MIVILPTSRKREEGKTKGYYRIGNRPHTAKFKVVRNVRLFTSYSIHSNLQDEIAGQDGVRKWMFCNFDMFDGRRSSENHR